MPVLIPNSNGADNAPDRRLWEFNKCHNPEGIAGGQFCSAPDSGSGGGPSLASAKVTRGVEIKTGLPKVQPYKVRFPLTDATLQQRMEAHSEDPNEQFKWLQREAPHVAEAAREIVEQAAGSTTEWGRTMATLAESLGFEKVHVDPTKEKHLLENEQNYVFMGPLKSVARVATKSTKYNGDVSRVRDLQRATIGLADMSHLKDTLQKISEVADIVDDDDRITKPTEDGYRDVQLIVRMKQSGILAEVLILSKPMMIAKNDGHKPYEEKRALPKAHPRRAVLTRVMTDLYNGAWAKTRGAATVGAAMALLPSILAAGGHR